MMKTLLIVNIFLLGIAGCIAPRTGNAPSNTVSVQSTIIANSVRVQRVRIDGGSYFFKPNHVTVQVNVPVELTIKVESGLIPHNFVIKAPEAGVMVEEQLSSDIKTIHFTPKAIGKITFYCSYGLPFAKSHREKGMEGIIDVVK